MTPPRRARIACVPILAMQKAVMDLEEPFPVRKTIRLPGFDYSTQGVYFITVCSHDRKNIFSRIVQGDVYEPAQVILSPLGQLILQNLRIIPQIYTSVSVLNACIMPNHIHVLFSVTEADGAGKGRSKMLIAKVVQSFKASVTRKASPRYASVWQPRYHDHVVRDEHDLLRIWKSIDSNPAKWMEDRYYTAIEDR